MHRGSLRVLHVVHSGAHGGGPRLVGDLARADDGHEHAVASAGDGPLLGTLDRDGITTFDIRSSRKRDLLGATRRLIGAVRSWNPDVVDCFGQFAGVLGAAVRIIQPGPLVYSAQYPSFYADFDVLRMVRNHAVERFTCGVADLVLAINEADADEYVRRRLAPAWKVQLSRNGVDASAFRPLAAESSDVLRIGFVGRLVDWKGVDVLLRALAQVTAELPPWRLTVLGDGEQRPELQRLSHDLRLGTQVVFQGAGIADAGWYAAQDLVVVPSIAEPFGIVAVEAMACERCVVASAVGGLRRTVADGVTGFLATPGNADDLAATILKAVAERHRWAAMGELGRERVVREFSLEQVVDEHNRALAAAAGGSR